MAIKGIKRAIEQVVPKAQETPKPQPRTTPTGTNEFASSKTSALNYSGSVIKHRLQNTQIDNGVMLQAFKNPADSPYANQTASQIAEEQLEIYRNSSDKKDAAEDTGRVIADIATYDPEQANEVANLFINSDDVRGKDKDELAQEFVQALSDDELKGIAESEQGRELLVEMQDQLTGGSVHADEMQDAYRIETALNPRDDLFTDGYEGVQIGDTFGVNPAFEDTTPAQGAHFVKFDSFATEESRTQAFTQALELHKDDPEWIANFFAELGPEATARYASNAAFPSTYNNQGMGGDIDYARENVNAVTNAFDILQENGYLDQAGMDAFVNEIGNGASPYLATELFSNSNSDVRTMFVNSAIDNGDDSLDVLAMEVLSTLPVGTANGTNPNTQNAILGDLSTNELNEFIAGAMSSSGEFLSFEGRVSNNSLYSDVEFDRLSGVETLIGNATQQTMQYYPYTSESNFPEELQTNIFNAATSALDNPRVFDRFKDNEVFENNLSRLFVENRDGILRANSSDVNGSISETSEKRLESFFQLTLMTPPQTQNYDALAHSVFEYVNTTSTALQDPELLAGDQGAYNDFTDTFGMTPEDATQLLGGVLGTIVDAAGNAQSQINSDNKAKAAQIEFFTGLAFAFIPGAGSLLGEGITNGFVKHFVEEGTGYLQGQFQDGLKDFIENGIASLGEDDPLESGQLANTLFREILGDLPNGDARWVEVDGENVLVPTLDLQAQLQTGFENTTRYTLGDDARNGE